MSPVFRHGRLRLYLLKLLDEAPRHGYEVIRLLQDRFLGIYSPSPGTIYPRLARLEEEGLVTHDEVDGKKVYRITEKGREEIHARVDDLADLEEELTESVRDIAREISQDVRETVRNLREELTWAARDVRREGRQARNTGRPERERADAGEPAGGERSAAGQPSGPDPAARAGQQPDAEQQPGAEQPAGPGEPRGAAQPPQAGPVRDAWAAASAEPPAGSGPSTGTTGPAADDVPAHGTSQGQPAEDPDVHAAIREARGQDAERDEASRIREDARQARDDMRDWFRAQRGAGRKDGGEWPGRPDWAAWANWQDWTGRRGGGRSGRSAGAPGGRGPRAGRPGPGFFRDLEDMAIDFARELRTAASQAEHIGEQGLGELWEILEDSLTRIRDEVFGAGDRQADHPAARSGAGAASTAGEAGSRREPTSPGRAAESAGPPAGSGPDSAESPAKPADPGGESAPPAQDEPGGDRDH